VNDAFIDGGTFSGLSRIDGFVLLLFFAIFLYYTFGISRVEKTSSSETPIHRYSLSRASPIDITLCFDTKK
jgi:cation:H+ antiporter